MKRYERELLNNLAGGTNTGDEEPLKNVKKALGSLSHVVGNPLFKAELSLRITTQFFFDDIMLGPVGYVLPAALPVQLQTFLPVYLLGLTDFYGGYVRMDDVYPPGNGWARIGGNNIIDSGVVGYTYANLYVPPALPNYQRGDFVMQFIAPVAGVGVYYAWVIVHCNNIAYGTFLNSFVSDLIIVNHLRMFVPLVNIAQFNNPVIFAYQTLFGNLATDTVDPNMYQLPSDFQNQICDLPVNFPVDKNLSIVIPLDVMCQSLDIIMFVQKVEPLTLRR